ncbi:hypothetical protein DOY81_010450 [Sarcophaga bullata]|nr:hypothetical protein DOY81_010450 [Sarcophaga bullata]
MMSTVPVTAAMNSCPQFPSALGSPYNVQAMISQQAAMYNWMQQVYSQYMQQCLRLSNTVDSSTVPSMAGTTFRPPIPPEFHQFFQQQFPSTVMPPIVPDTTNIATANIAASTDGTTPEGQQDQQQQQQQQQGQQEPAAVGQVAAPRFPNLPQDEHDNRDWLDNFFSITRLAIFLTLLYFNSSPLRCLVVVIIAGGIYLYHIGAFRLRHERNNNNLNRNNNAAQNAAVDQIRQGVDQQQNAVAAPAIRDRRPIMQIIMIRTMMSP